MMVFNHHHSKVINKPFENRKLTTPHVTKLTIGMMFTHTRDIHLVSIISKPDFERGLVA